MTSSPERVSAVPRPSALTLTATSVEHEYAKARAAGYAAGWSQGAQAAQESIRREVDDHRAQLTGALEAERDRLTQATQALHEAAAQMRQVTGPAVEQHVDAVLSAALELAEAVLTHETLASASPGADAIRRAMSAAPEVHAVRIRLSVQDAETLQDTNLPHDVTVVPDAKLQPGDSVLEHATGAVEILLHEAMQRARVVLES